MPTLLPQVEALRRLQIIASKTAQRLNSLNGSSSTPDYLPELESRDVTFAPLDLPIPEEALTPILNLNTSESVRNAIRKCFIDRIAELQLKCNTNYQQTCTSIPKTALLNRRQRLQEAYLNFYSRQCHVLVESQLPYVMNEVAKLERSALRPDTKTEFNHEYTPILESYFAYNAYPSLPDRLLLARKSMMTPRQIEVWFQNHRNRAKKDGLTPRRISLSTASTFAFDKLVPQAPQAITARRSRSATAESGSPGDDLSSEHREECFFKDYRPPHAFPTPYSAESRGDPSPLANQPFKLAPHDWMRSPAAHAPQHSSMTVHDLTELFAQMNMRGPSKSSKSQRKWASPLVVAPSAAPHPSILNPGYTSPLHVIQALDRCTWQTPSLRTRKSTTSRSQVSYPSWAVPDTCRRRKALGIPRRIPSSPANTHRLGTNPRTLSTISLSSSSSSSSSPSSFGSRSTSMSSLSSEYADINPTIIPMSDFVNMSDYTVTNAQWDLSLSSELQYMSATLPKNGFSDLSQCLAIPDMDLPAFTFFES